MTNFRSTSSTASAKQLSFISALFAEAKSGFEKADAVLIDQLTPKVASIQPVLVAVIGKQEVDRADASNAIGVLIAVRDALTAALAPPLPAGLAALKPTKVIPNKFDAACALCHARVATGEGHAVLAPAWKTVCVACAETDPAERQAALEAERAAARAERDEERLAELARQDALRAAQRDARALACDLFRRAEVQDQKRPSVRLAIPSNGANDLDFLNVSRSTDGAVQVLRVIGGRNDQPLAAAQAVALLERIACVDSIPAAIVTYGVELGVCGRCGRHLTDEDSRAAGIGPDCASRLGW
jgi:hypothetical protein